MFNPLQSYLNYVAKKFSSDASKMLIRTGVAGWTLSSLAQIVALVVNPKIEHEQKGFLIPQEIYDAVVNVGAFFIITQATKKFTEKLFTTGKYTPQSVRAYIKQNPEIFKDKIGKLDFDLGKKLGDLGQKELLKKYKSVKNIGTTIATIGASIISTNIITPIIRNKMASRVQKGYLNANKELNEQSNNPVGNTIQSPQQTFKARSLYKPYNYSTNSLKI